MLINRVLEPAILSQLYQLLTMIGICLCVYVTQKAGHDEVSSFDPFVMRWARRTALLGVAAVMGWSVVYMERNNCPPWPPMVAMMGALDVLFGARALTLYWRSMPSHRLSRRIGHFFFARDHGSGKGGAR